MTAYEFAFLLVVIVAVVLVGIQISKWVIKTAVREALWEHEKMMAALEKESDETDGPQ